MTTARRKQLSADDWTAAALQALTGGGLVAVAVEPLAKALGTTKGSFYWHFADRDALVRATLERWEQRDTDGVIAAVEESADVGDRLRRLLRLVLGSVSEGPGAGAGSVELALQASATHPLVAPVLARVTGRRLDYLTALFEEAGLDRTPARDRALLAYTTFLGHAQLAHASPRRLPRGRAFTAHVDQLVELLVR